ncbi:MAG: hypothetical protein LAO31_07400 [Acidobacteriia bacterium]|nr:hypothetical protein [Terriglobia bacterium]
MNRVKILAVVLLISISSSTFSQTLQKSGPSQGQQGQPETIDFLSVENISRFSFVPEDSWSATYNTLVFTEVLPQIRGYATFKEVLPRKQAFSMTVIVTPWNIRELGFGFAGGFQLSTLFPQDGKSYELYLVVSGDKAAYWVGKSKRGSYYSWGGTLKLGVLCNDNRKSKKAIYSKLEFKELTVDEANKLLKKRKK